MTKVSSVVAGSEEGSAFQFQIPPSVHGINVANTIAANGNVTSNVIVSEGYQKGAVGVQSTQAGAINVQRYLDEAATIPVGALLTAALVANTAQWLTWVDGLPYVSFTVQVTNSSGSTAATLSKLAIVLQSG